MLFSMKYSNVLSRLKQLTQERGLTQSQLAQHLGVTRAAVGNWWQGARRPKWEALSSWADLVGYEVALVKVGAEHLEDEDQALLGRLRAALPLMSTAMKSGISTFADLTLAETRDTTQAS
jgi:transcriptional regulator with XRE-family HTH domain